MYQYCGHEMFNRRNFAIFSFRFSLNVLTNFEIYSEKYFSEKQRYPSRNLWAIPGKFRKIRNKKLAKISQNFAYMTTLYTVGSEVVSTKPLRTKRDIYIGRYFSSISRVGCVKDKYIVQIDLFKKAVHDNDETCKCCVSKD